MMDQTRSSPSCTHKSVSQPHSAQRPLLDDVISADKDAMDYFRALSAAEEHSERGLELTETIIRMNPAHYTVWSVSCAHA